MQKETLTHPARLVLLPTLLILAILLGAASLRLMRFPEWPPGLSHDEAINGIDTFHLSRYGAMPLYLIGGEPEPVYRTLGAVLVGLIGPTRFSLRLWSVFLGILGVAAAYRAGRHLVPMMPSSTFTTTWRHIAGLLAAGTLAVLVGHIHLSRVAYRGILLPFALLMFFDAFVVAWQTHRRRHFLAAGFWLGLSGMTYTSGLLVIPVALIGILIALLLHLSHSSERSHKNTHAAPSPGSHAQGKTLASSGWLALLTGIFWMVLAFLIAFSPMLILLILQPGIYARVGEVSRGGSVLDTTTLTRYWRSVVETIPALYQTGDINPQYNVAQAPVLHWQPLSALLVAGMAACLLRWRRLASWMALGLLGAMLLPVALAQEARHGLRIVGEYGAVPLVIAASVDLLARSAAVLRRFVPDHRVRIASVLGVALIIGAAGARAAQIYTGYFTSDVRWGEGGVISAFTWFFETRRLAVAEEIAQSSDVIYVPLTEVMHPSFRYFTANSHPRVATYADYFGADQPLNLPAGRFLIPPSSGAATFAAFMPDGTLVLLPRFDEAALEDLRGRMMASSAILTDDYGEAAAIPFDFPVDGSDIVIDQPIRHPVDINYDNQFRIVGWDTPLELPQDGRPVNVTLYLARAPETRRVAYLFIQLWTVGLDRLSGSSEVLTLRWVYLPSQWTSESIVPIEIELPVPEGLPSGAYYIAAGFRDARGNLIPVLGADGARVADMAITGTVKIPRPEAVSTEGMLPAEAQFGDEIALIGYGLTDSAGTPLDELASGSTAIITLYWKALRQPQADYTAFLHAVDTAGNLVAQSDVKPGNGAYPTVIWSEGEIVTTTHVITLPPDQSGPFTLYAGWYSFPTLERLPVIQDGTLAEDRRAVITAP